MKSKLLSLFMIIILAFSFCGCQKEEAVNLTEKQKLEDFQYMYSILKENYPFFEVNKRLSGVDFLAKKEEYIKRIKETYTDKEFYDALAGILNDLHNGHINMFNGDTYVMYKTLYKDFPGGARWYQELNKKVAIDRYKKDTTTSQSNNAPSMESYVIPNNYETSIIEKGEVAYLRIGSLNSSNVDEDMKGIKPFLREVKDYKTLIIDIRGNGGGDSRYWSDNLVPMLISKPYTDIQYFVYRGGKFQEKFIKSKINKDFSSLDKVSDIDKEGLKNAPPELKKEFNYYEKIQWTINPKDSIGFTGKIFLIVDNKVFSSSEMLAVFCKDTGFATIVGEKTGGDGIGNDPLLCTLPNSGYVFRFPHVLGLHMDGTCDEEFKIAPDIEAPVNRGKSLSVDPAVKKILEIGK